MVELNAICRDRTISDNNKKADLMREVLTEYDVPFKELGPGTNRYAVRIDAYVFKIAMDQYGIDDNRNEAAMSRLLQPFVAKTYECNDLIVVSEYVTVISKAEFAENEATIKAILAQLAERYIFGDIGFTLKNFVNWGYRENGDLVILDYGYIYKVIGDEVRCTNRLSDEVVCGEFLEYDSKFSDLVCPKCRKKYTYDDIRRRIDRKFEREQVQRELDKGYLVTSPETIFDDDTGELIDTFEENIDGKEDSYMAYEMTEEERIEARDYAIEHAAEIVSRARCSDTVVDDSPSYDCDDEYDERDYGYGETDEKECIWMDDEFDVIELFGVPAIFTNERICDTEYIPEGYNKYHFRETDDFESFGEIAKNIFVNHGGSFIINGKIDESCLPLKIDQDAYSFGPENISVTSMTLREYMEAFSPNAVIIDQNTIDAYMEEPEYENIMFDDDDCDDDDYDVDECDVDIDTIDDDDEFEDDPEDDDIPQDCDDEPETIDVVDTDNTCEDTTDDEPEAIEVITADTDECVDDDESEEESTTISDIIEDIAEEEVDETPCSVDEPDEYPEDLDNEELFKELEDRLADTTDEVLSVEQNSDGDIQVDTVRTIWSDPDPEDVESMRNDLARLAEEEDKEESRRRRSNHYKHNKRYR